MKRFLLCVLAGAGLLTAAACETKQMAMDPAAIVAKRQALMKDNGAAWAAINDYLEKGQGSSADVIARAEAVADAAGGIPDLFPEGTSVDDMPGVSYAKADIWANWSQFQSAANTLAAEASKLAEVAKTGDKAAIKAQFDAFGGACGGCHKPFRIKKET